MTTPPAVSVICPVFNRSAAICATIRSVQAQLMTSWELIVVLDGCTDDSRAWVERCSLGDSRITVVSTAGFGHPGPARNIGLALAAGAVVAYLDHDDTWLPRHLEVVLRLFADGAELVATGCSTTDGGGRPLAQSAAVELCWAPELQLLSPLFQPSRVAHRAGLVEAVGGWRAGIGLEDWDLWVRLADAGHRFRTTAARTAVLTEHRDSRRFGTARRHRMPLAEFSDPRAAGQTLTDLRDGDLLGAMGEAAAADAVGWFAALRRAGTLVLPDAWAADEQGLMADVAAAAHRSALRWADDLVVLPSGRRFVLSLSLWCATAELAQRVELLSRRVLTRQLELITRVARGGGGRPVGSRSQLAGRPAHVTA
jgi:glycosyltransferase involved in cell wall biosynthesis